VGWVPGNVFATIEVGLAVLAAGCQAVGWGGARGEPLSFARAAGACGAGRACGGAGPQPRRT
ncbi:DUF3830 family protein, partial [Kocuria flava]|uniref:DUF3830 family protein n=1 Tax=Kocuria flava TaxID=446860 RepID=UPI003F1E28B2